MVVNESSNKSLGFFHLILFRLQAEIDIITEPNYIYIYIYYFFFHFLTNSKHHN